jgi:PAS domain S-box-containing protein
MAVLSDIREDILIRIRKIRVRNSIAIPIVLILLSIAMVVLVTGYYVNKSVFYSVFEERESNKARNIHLTIESIVATEVKRVSSFAKILKNDTDIVYGLFHYTGTHGDTKPLKSAMDQLYPKMNLPVFVMADPDGNILYRAGKGKDLPAGRLREIPAFRRAIKGEQVITASQGPGGWGIWTIVPVYSFGNGKPSGMIFLGSRIDNTFARRIAQETGSQVFIATAERVIAGSYDSALPKAFDFSLARSSLAAKKPNFQLDRTNYRSYTYVPLKIVDDEFCLVIETDIGVIRDLLAKNRVKMMEWGIALLFGIALIGIVLTLTLIWPLNRLYGKALHVIREYSGTGLDVVPRGNEISTLVRANDVMLETIKNHLSERTRAEEALRETSRTLQALIEASPLAVVVSDAFGMVRVWNPAAVRLFGWREEEAVGHPNPLLSAEGNPELCVTCNLVLHGEKFSNMEIRGRRCDGSEVILVFSGAPLTDAGGNVVAMMAIVGDISDAKRAEMALRKSEEQLLQSQKMEAVGKLAGGVAHDFNNLLSVITGYTELLLFKLDGNDPARRELEEIHRAGEHAAALTGQLLAFSRRQVLQPKLLQLPGVVENIGKMIRRLIGEDIEFITEASPDPWTVRADPSQVDQILMNLVVNARDAMPRGGKLVISTANLALESPFVERELTIPPGRYATLKVVDNGCGMDEAILSRIFEPFYTTKEKGKGTGLGLATVYGIVKQSDGYIRVQSAPGVGTSITVYLPETVGGECEAKEESRRSVSDELTGKETILLVEDEEMVRELAVESLQRYGYTILEAANGDKALSICEGCKGTIDLLITDLVMPGMNGIELAGRFRDSRPGVPILFMSGYAEDALEYLGDMGDQQSFLQKPITPTSLSRKVREMFSEPIPA